MKTHLTNREYRIDLGLMQPDVMPDDIDVNAIAEDACQAAFKLIADRLTEATDGATTWGDMDPLASLMVDHIFRQFVLTMAVNNVAIQALQPVTTEVCDECGQPMPDEAEVVGTYHSESCSLHPENTVTA